MMSKGGNERWEGNKMEGGEGEDDHKILQR